MDDYVEVGHGVGVWFRILQALWTVGSCQLTEHCRLNKTLTAEENEYYGNREIQSPRQATQACLFGIITKV